MKAIVPTVRVDGPMEEGHGRNKAAEKLAHVVTHGLANYAEKRAVISRKRRKMPKPIRDKYMTDREWSLIQDSYKINNSFSNQHPFLTVGMILAGYFMVRWLLGV